MNAQCSECEQSFEPEPGFYFGAMFVAYGFNVIMAISTWLVLYFVFHPDFKVYVIVIIVMNILLVPFLFRYSRVLFLYGFGGIQFNKKLFNLKQ